MISAAPSKVIYQGNGSTTAFSFAMQLPVGSNGSEIVVSIIDNLGNVTVPSGNYVVTVNPGGAGGSVAYPTVGGVSPLGLGINALPGGWSIAIQRIVPLSQLLSIITQGVFDGPSLTAALDRLTMIVQQLQDQLSRCLQYPINVAPTANMLNPTTLILTLGNPITNATYPNLKAQAALNPTQAFWGLATDLGTPGEGEVVFYCGNALIGDGGFIVLGGG